MLSAITIVFIQTFYFTEYICLANHSFSDGTIYRNVSCVDQGLGLDWEPITDNCSGGTIITFAWSFRHFKCNLLPLPSSYSVQDKLTYDKNCIKVEGLSYQRQIVIVKPHIYAGNKIPECWYTKSLRKAPSQVWVSDKSSDTRRYFYCYRICVVYFNSIQTFYTNLSPSTFTKGERMNEILFLRKNYT